MSTFSSNIGPEEEDGAGWSGLVASKDELRKEAIQRALEQDAARYRWLKANAVREKNLGDKYIEYHCDFESWNDIDASIDAARRLKR